MSEESWIRDVGEADFEAEVLERSRERPVVVDFWAPWCGPCRTLTPLLERLAREHAGEFVLARVNVDEAPALAQAFGIRAVPTVLGVRDGHAVAEFDGAQPEPAVRTFLARLLPTQADRLAVSGDAHLEAGDTAAAEADYAMALEQDVRQHRAELGLARIRAERGEVEAARDLLERIPPGTDVSADADRLAASLRIEAGDAGDLEALRRRVADAPDDLAARLELGQVLAAQQDWEEALAALLEVVRREPGFADEAARKAMLDVFEVLGSDHPLTQQYRQDLARLLFR